MSHFTYMNKLSHTWWSTRLKLVRATCCSCLSADVCTRMYTYTSTQARTHTHTHIHTHTYIFTNTHTYIHTHTHTYTHTHTHTQAQISHTHQGFPTKNTLLSKDVAFTYWKLIKDNLQKIKFKKRCQKNCKVHILYWGEI